MGCLFCASQESDTMLFSLFFSCPWCGQPMLVTYQEYKNLAQCCECGILLSGPYIGLTCCNEYHKPDLRIGQTHGMCEPCRTRKWDEYVAKKALRKHKV